jgi:hypothetical protein
MMSSLHGARGDEAGQVQVVEREPIRRMSEDGSIADAGTAKSESGW